MTENGAEKPLVAGTRIRLTFGTDDAITATAGCNILGGEVEITETGSSSGSFRAPRWAATRPATTRTPGWPGSCPPTPPTPSQATA